jgi:hypothetical protein
MFKRAKLVIFIIVVISLLVLTLTLYILIEQPFSFWNKVVYSGFIPRVIAWTSLVTAVYGLSRRRFSPLIVIFFFVIAFFFAYVGVYLLPDIY